MKRPIQLDAPNVSLLEKEYLSKCIDLGFVSTFGPFVPEFEERFAKYLNIKKAVSTQSGTAAIHMALHQLGIGKGDEVIVPATTFIATVNPLIYVGATPVFADIDMNTWGISPQEIKKRITRKTKAIIAVHLYGNPCDMHEIIGIAKKHRLFVIEDAAHSLGAKYNNRHTGTFGNFGCFSFNGNKVITTGGGGMIVGRNTKQLEHIKFIINQARDETKGYYHTEIGFNYRMTNLEAALGLAQMRRLGDFLNKKRRFNKIYRERLGSLGAVRFQQEYRNAVSSFWLTCMVFKNNIKIPTLQKKLKRQGIPTRRAYMPLTEFPLYRRCRQTSLKNSYALYDRGLCFPGSTLNSEEDISYICGKLCKEL